MHAIERSAVAATLLTSGSFPIATRRHESSASALLDFVTLNLARQMTKKIRQNQEFAIVQLKKDTSEAADGVAKVAMRIMKFEGPLMAQVKGGLDKLRVQRQVFHSGNFNGPDLKKYYFGKRPAILQNQFEF